MPSRQLEDDSNEEQERQQCQQGYPAQAGRALPALKGARWAALGRVLLSRHPHTATRSGTADRGWAAAARSGDR
jgi:hypothetical protein